MTTLGLSLSWLFALSPEAGDAFGAESFGSWPVTAGAPTKLKIADTTIMIETKQAILFLVEPIVYTPFSGSFLLVCRP
jgi:hypothetical protein